MKILIATFLIGYSIYGNEECPKEPYINYTLYSPFSNPINYTCLPRTVDTLIVLDEEKRQASRSYDINRFEGLRRTILENECVRR